MKLSISGLLAIPAFALAVILGGIAVGMPVTEHPPHRTGRAAFPHPAPTSDV